MKKNEISNYILEYIWPKIRQNKNFFIQFLVECFKTENIWLKSIINIPVNSNPQ